MGGTYRLSRPESRLLHMLEINARRPYTHYAKKLKISPDSVKRMIDKLQKLGILENFYTIVNLPKIGYMYARIWIKYNKITQKEEEQLIERLRRHPKCGWIVTGEGRFDLIVLFVTQDIEELKHVAQDFFTTNSKIIKEKDISIQTQLNHFNHNFLYHKRDHEDIKYRDIKNQVSLEETDLQILKMLAIDARKSTFEIAGELKLSYNTVKNRINRMMHDRIILGFKPKINSAPLGYQHFKVFLTLEKLDIHSIRTLKTYLFEHQNVLYITKALGRYDLEFEIELEERKLFNEFMREFRNKFFDIIRDYSVVQHYSEPYINYFPD